MPEKKQALLARPETRYRKGFQEFQPLRDWTGLPVLFSHHFGSFLKYWEDKKWDWEGDALEQP